MGTTDRGPNESQDTRLDELILEADRDLVARIAERTDLAEGLLDVVDRAEEDDLDEVLTRAYMDLTVCIDARRRGRLVTPTAALNVGVLLSERGDVSGAVEAYRLVIDSSDPDAMPTAAALLGALLSERDDLEGAMAAYRMAIGSGHADAMPTAAVNVGVLLSEQGDVSGAVEAYRMAIDSGHADAMPTAAALLGALLTEHDDLDGAMAAYRMAIDSGHTDAMPTAVAGLRPLLVRQEAEAWRGTRGQPSTADLPQRDQTARMRVHALSFRLVS